MKKLPIYFHGTSEGKDKVADHINEAASKLAAAMVSTIKDTESYCRFKSLAEEEQLSVREWITQDSINQAISIRNEVLTRIYGKDNLRVINDDIPVPAEKDHIADSFKMTVANAADASSNSLDINKAIDEIRESGGIYAVNGIYDAALEELKVNYKPASTVGTEKEKAPATTKKPLRIIDVTTFNIREFAEGVPLRPTEVSIPDGTNLIISHPGIFGVPCGLNFYKGEIYLSVWNAEDGAWVETETKRSTFTGFKNSMFFTTSGRVILDEPEISAGIIVGEKRSLTVPYTAEICVKIQNDNYRFYRFDDKHIRAEWYCDERNVWSHSTRSPKDIYSSRNVVWSRKLGKPDE